MFKQSGFQETHFSTEDGATYVGILHGTPVVTVEPSPNPISTGEQLTLRSGGWHTRATAKAMNRGLLSNGLHSRFTVQLLQGQLILNDGLHKRSISDKLTLSV